LSDHTQNVKFLNAIIANGIVMLYNIQAVWNAMPMDSNLDINIEYSATIKNKLAEKRKLCKQW
jgi:uncharacterized protein YfaA (DUF2138 family)